MENTNQDYSDLINAIERQNSQMLDSRKETLSRYNSYLIGTGITVIGFFVMQYFIFIKSNAVNENELKSYKETQVEQKTALSDLKSSIDDLNLAVSKINSNRFTKSDSDNEINPIKSDLKALDKSHNRLELEFHNYKTSTEAEILKLRYEIKELSSKKR